MSQEIVTISFFQYKSLKKIWWAFAQMGKLPRLLQKVEGLFFVKMLGSGGKQGFGIFPNFGLYGLLCVWKDEQSYENFFKCSEIFQKLQSHSEKHQTIFLQTLNAHGKWDGKEPFSHKKQKPQAQEKIAVITRASIKWNKVWKFWSSVAPASKKMYAHPGLIFSVGIGEFPLIQQATFSIWENIEAMTDYAYKSPQHKKVIQMTQRINWYKEELFARFLITKIEGEGIINFS